MLMIGPYQESQMRLDDQTKQDSLSLMSKLFVKKKESLESDSNW